MTASLSQIPENAHLSIDTRTLKPGDIFVALKGETHDGHDFVEAAFAKGARAAVVDSTFKSNGAHPLIVAPDPLVAMQDFAKAHLKAMPAKRIALTGSSGKTTTKELIRCALAACLSDEAVIASGGNLNNHIGVPLSALNVRPEHKAAIFEMGMNHFGEIATLTRIVSPDVALIINIGSAHSGNLGGAEGVAKAKAELFENMSPQAIAVVNVDDPRCVREAESKVHGRRINFGRAHWADLRLKQVEAIDATHQRLVFAYKNREVETVLPMPGFHNALNACAALAVACALSLDLETAAKGLQSMKAVKGRLRVHELKNEVTLIDDTYNANPESMEAGLTVLASYPETRRRVAVLGGMGELGDKTPGHHRSIGALVAQKKIDALFTCGESAIAYAEGAIAQGFDRSQIVWAENSEALAAIVADKVKAKDVIFVKGSRTTSMEKVVEKLLGALAEAG